jgi:CheY-like chemotaxis protein
MEQKKRLGEIFIEQSILTPLTVNRLVDVSKELKKRFGTILVEMGLVTGEELANALAQQFNCRTIFNFSNNSFPRHLLDLIPYEVALQNQLFPLKLQDDILALAITDPTDIKVVKNISDNNKLRMILFVTTSKEINAAICRHYFGMNVVEPTKKTILVVDNDKMDLTMLSQLLSREYTVHVACDGMEAYKEVLAKKPHVVLTDKEIPKLDAFGLFDALRNVPETKTIPMILTASKGSPELETLAFNKGFFDYIAKPANPLSVLNRVRRAFDFSEKEHFLFMK